LRGIVKELHSNEAYRKFCKISDKILSIGTLSYRTSQMDFNALIQKVILLYELNTGHKAKDVAIDSTMVKPCKDHRAQLQRKQHKYTDKHASWIKTTKHQWEYGYKAHFSCDTETSLILKYSFATAKEHDSLHFKDLIYSISQSTYILLDSAYDSEEIYNTIFEKTSAIPIIDINPRRGSSKPSKKDDLNRWAMKNLRIKYALLYKDRWEIERVNVNLKSTYFFSLEDVYYVPHRHYKQAVGLKLLVHNLVAFANISVGLPKNRKLETVTL